MLDDCNQIPALVQVAAYARKYRYLQQDYDDAASRLHAVERLLKQYQCSTSEELLTEVDQAQADLDRWYELEGDSPYYTLDAAFHPLCKRILAHTRTHAHTHTHICTLATPKRLAA